MEPQNTKPEIPAVSNGQQVQPTPIIKYLSTHATEYFLMLLSMALSAFSLGAILHSAVDQLTGADSSYYTEAFSIAGASLMVALPIFAILFLRLKLAERKNPVKARDFSRHRLVQLTLVLTFVIGISKLTSYFYSLLNSSESYDSFSIFDLFGFFTGSSGTDSAMGNFLHMCVTVGIAGGIFVYYWIDHHRNA